MTDKAIYTHPSNIGALGTIQIDDSLPSKFDGIPIYVNKHLPATRPTGKVNFPKDGNWRFCEFEEKDEGWALGLGIATREEEPVYYMIEQPMHRFEYKLDTYYDGFINGFIQMVFEQQIDEIRERIEQSILNKINDDIWKMGIYL